MNDLSSVTSSSAQQSWIAVDLDGTLVRTDTLYESVFKLLQKNPLSIFQIIFWLLRGRSFLKSMLAERVRLSAKYLPYNEELISFLREKRSSGAKLVLATAAHQSIADSVAEHLGIFDRVIGTTESVNLKSELKLNALIDLVGSKNFTYAGDSSADLPIWKGCGSAITVGLTGPMKTAVQQTAKVRASFEWPKSGLKTWLKALRVHQWAKNVLIFVPLIMGFGFFDLAKVMGAALAFLSFSLVASGTYIANDLWDLENDRQHARKKKRPFACGSLSIVSGILIATLSIAIGFAIGFAVSAKFAALLLFYLVATTAYSLALKHYVLLDTISLSGLYTLRIFAGAIATGIAVSQWLLAFSVFFFVSLALIKRCSELLSLEKESRSATKGRDYRVGDLVVLWPLGVSSAVGSVILFGIFVNLPETRERYLSPSLLWLVALALVYWLGRLWIKTARGEMHDDPIVYAALNRGSVITVAGMLITVLLAKFTTVFGI
jgi:4-hydroxybenzoate polyprenyltransferase/phosphoglycolate phosphatase-like HAD superfamily hydrolase